MQIRTDLAMESGACEGTLSGVITKTLRHDGVEEIQVTIETEEAAKALGKPMGRYITLCHPAILHAGPDERQSLIRALAEIIRDLVPPFGDLMVVGLGNRHITADALGSRTVESLLVTRHMKDAAPEALCGRLRGVCAVAPGVLGVTGVETAEMVQGIAQHVHPSAVIAIDALAARESSRICTTIQVTDTGIQPGSGVGNHRLGLTRDTMGVPVIAVGVPMVVYAAVIARDALAMLLSDVGLPQQEHEQAMDQLIEKVIQNGLGDLVVTPREVDELVGQVARIIGDALNLAFQPRLSEEEIQLLSHDHL